MRMQKKRSLLYITIVAVIYVLIGVIEFFIGPFILDVVTDNRWIQLMIFIICLISINIILTAFITSKIPYKIEGLRKLEKPKELRKRKDEETSNKEVKQEDTNGEINKIKRSKIAKKQEAKNKLPHHKKLKKTAEKA